MESTNFPKKGGKKFVQFGKNSKDGQKYHVGSKLGVKKIRPASKWGTKELNTPDCTGQGNIRSTSLGRWNRWVDAAT
jgi:hypothetical protein